MKAFAALILVVGIAVGAFFYFAPKKAEGVWQQALGMVGLASPPNAGAGANTQAGSGGTSAGAGSGRSGGRGGGVVTVLTAAAKQADFPVRRYAVGFLSSPAVVEISARISSQIVAIQAKDGQRVKAGDPLFSLDDRALKAQVDKDAATLQKDQAMLTSANSDLKRAKDLLAKQAGTQQTLDTATAAQLAATAQITADQAALEADNIQLGFATIKSPIDGRLGAVQVAVGDLVSTSSTTPLVTVTQMTPVDATFNLPESDLALARQALADGKANNVGIRINGSDQQIATGTLYFVDSSVDVGSGTVQAKATIPNEDFKLWPGQYVNVVLDAGSMPNLVSVPTIAVQAGQKGPFVYLVKDEKSVEVRQVKVALTVGGNTAISEGLTAGDVVVTDGQAQLKNGAAIKVGKPTENSPKTDQGDTSKPSASAKKPVSSELASAP